MSTRQDLMHAMALLSPMFVLLSETGHIEKVGPTLQKLCPENTLIGQRFMEVFRFDRPHGVTKLSDIMAWPKTHLRVSFRDPPNTALKGIIVPLQDQGQAIVNLSFGISVLDAVRDHKLNSSDFAATDLAIELLYLVEAKSAAMSSSRKLNHRLQGAMIAAEEKAFTDTLTGLRNRRTVDYELDRLVAQKRPFSLLHLDLDYFKAVNDTYGHAAGDHVLETVARIMMEVTRDQDIVARVGGDEFVLICENLMDQSRISELCKTLIQRISEPVTFRSVTCEISASIGICFASPKDTDPAVLLNRADLALYAAKHAGRGKHMFYEPAMGQRQEDRVNQAS